MSQQPQIMDLIFLGVVVLLLITRLRSVLWTKPSKTETEQKKGNVIDISLYQVKIPAEEEKNVMDEEDVSLFVEEPEALKGVEKIKKAYPSFVLEEFIDKASRAFEFIANEFAEGNKEDLKQFISPTIFGKFEQVIDERAEKKHKAEFTLIAFKSVTLVGAELKRSIAELTVCFETEQTNLIKDENGEIVAGDPTYIESVTDIWTFKKDMKSSSPVWILEATRAKA